MPGGTTQIGNAAGFLIGSLIRQQLGSARDERRAQEADEILDVLRRGGVTIPEGPAPEAAPESGILAPQDPDSPFENREGTEVSQPQEPGPLESLLERIPRPDLSGIEAPDVLGIGLREANLDNANTPEGAMVELSRLGLPQQQLEALEAQILAMQRDRAIQPLQDTIEESLGLEPGSLRGSDQLTTGLEVAKLLGNNRVTVRTGTEVKVLDAVTGREVFSGPLPPRGRGMFEGLGVIADLGSDEQGNPRSVVIGDIRQAGRTRSRAIVTQQENLRVMRPRLEGALRALEQAEESLASEVGGARGGLATGATALTNLAGALEGAAELAGVSLPDTGLLEPVEGLAEASEEEKLLVSRIAGALAALRSTTRRGGATESDRKQARADASRIIQGAGGLNAAAIAQLRREIAEDFNLRVGNTPGATEAGVLKLEVPKPSAPRQQKVRGNDLRGRRGVLIDSQGRRGIFNDQGKFVPLDSE